MRCAKIRFGSRDLEIDVIPVALVVSTAVVGPPITSTAHKAVFNQQKVTTMK
jgi:hypothetical protein